jgi:hypothetical protein
MSEQPYLDLLHNLNEINPNFLTESGVEIKILKKTFSPEEAHIASLLDKEGKTSEEIAAKCQIPAKDIKFILVDLNDRRVLFSQKVDGTIKYRLRPFHFMISNIAFPDKGRMGDEEIIELLHEYDVARSRMLRKEPLIFQIECDCGLWHDEAYYRIDFNKIFELKIKCRKCEKEINFYKGLKKAFGSENLFIVQRFRFSYEEYGNLSVTPGQIEKVTFNTPYTNIPDVHFSPYEKFIYIKSLVMKDHFLAISSIKKNESSDGLYEIGWWATGDKENSKVPLWREVISNSKGHQVRKDYRLEVIDLETAFELFIDDYLITRLKERGWRKETLGWLSTHFLRNKMDIGFRELEGRTLDKLFKEEYSNWRKDLYHVRNGVVHQGKSVNCEEIKKAREALFGIITKIDVRTLEQFGYYRTLK